MKSVEAILEEHRIRITPMRQLLLEYFLKENKSIGLTNLARAFPKSDRITMFRTLKTFVNKGVLHKIENGQIEAKYALCKEYCTSSEHQDQHPHFQCLQCGDINCLETVFIPRLQLPEGYQTQESTMLIKGICNQCSQEN